jgi:hypothetical protein
MAISTKSILGLAAAATLLGACATGPYYDNGYGYGYNNAYPYDNAYSYDNGYAYAPGPTYYDSPAYYAAPSVGFGIGFAGGGTSWDHDHHEWHGDRDGRREWHGGDRGGRQWQGGDRDSAGRSDGYGSRDPANDHGQRSGG